MSGLIERIEAGGGPDREIDLLIMRYVENIGGPAENALHYTASIDAAMTLVPTPYWMLRNEDGGPVATIMDCMGREYEVKSATPALALVSAALRARETTPSIKGGDRG